MRLLLVIVMFLTSAVETAGAAERDLLNKKAPEFTLQDQYDRTVALHGLEGRIVVLLANDREGSARNSAWQKAIIEKYGDSITFLGLADVSSAPFFLKGKIKNDFKKNESILLDWKGEVFAAYGLAKKVSNIIVIDKQGYIRYVNAGAATPAAIASLFAAIDSL
ncbi:MAG TPA: YtfJ family protein [Nitrospirota bacterium]|nr:YtfJ family protein [Nitrospirota bacterium]